MKLAVFELLNSDSMTQKFTVGDSPIVVNCFRLHLYKHLAPAGTLYVKLEDANGNLIKLSSAVTISSISSANYFHGFVKFDCPVSLMANTSYYLELTASGYSYSGSAFIGWVQAGALANHSDSYSGAALNFEIWAEKGLQKGVF